MNTTTETETQTTPLTATPSNLPTVETPQVAASATTQELESPEVSEVGKLLEGVQRDYLQFTKDFDVVFKLAKNALRQTISAASGTGIDQFNLCAQNVRRVMADIKKVQGLKASSELNEASQQLLREVKVDANVKVEELLTFTMRAAPFVGPNNLSSALHELMAAIDIKVKGLDA